jgi:hypothetical protein
MMPESPNARTSDASASLLKEAGTALRGIMAHFDCDFNAPGHGHSRRGIWDDDAGNRAVGRANRSCDWCAQWEYARATLARIEESGNA